jgi:hypothetical protein
MAQFAADGLVGDAEQRRANSVARRSSMMDQTDRASLRSDVWQKIALGVLACGASAIGALAVGALLIGSLRIGKLSVRAGSFERLEVDELIVHRLRVDDVDAVPTANV